MSEKEGSCNGNALDPNRLPNCFKSDALDPNWLPNCFKTQVLDNRLQLLGHEYCAEGGSGGAPFITYKRQRRTSSASDTRPHEGEGDASVDATSQSAHQSRWRDTVLQSMYQSLSDDEGGIQGCIRDAITYHSVMDCIDNIKVSSDEVGLRSESLLQAKKLANSVPNGTSVGALPNGPLNGSNQLTVTENCRHAFFNIVKSEKFTSLSKLLSENFQGIKVDKLFNLKIINSRMKAGAYEDSPMLFLDDIQQVWKTIQVIGTEMTSIAKSLSEASQTLYNEQFGTEQADFNVKQEQAEAYRFDDVCTCRHCGTKANGNSCLVCDSCEEIYHVSCIEAFVENTPPKSWYCANCNTAGKGSPHKNCVVCKRLNVDGGSLLDPGCGDLLDEEMIYAGNEEILVENLGYCKICDNVVENVKNLKICEHPYCPNKYYHSRCLTNKQKQSHGPVWYCPSCLCRTCLIDRDDEKIVLCDCCDNAYHIYCMNPPRDSIPEGKWFCCKCEAGIQRIRKAREIYEEIEMKIEDSKRAFCNNTAREPNGDCIEESDKGCGAMDMLLNAANTLNIEENLAAVPRVPDIFGEELN